MQQVYDHAVLSDNDTEIYVAVFQVLCLLCTELGASSSLVDLARMALALQVHSMQYNIIKCGRTCTYMRDSCPVFRLDILARLSNRCTVFFRL